MSPVFPSGPSVFMREEYVKVATRKAKKTLNEMVSPNLKKKVNSVVKRKMPLPRVVRNPPKILTPIYLRACCILRSLVFSLECMYSAE